MADETKAYIGIAERVLEQNNLVQIFRISQLIERTCILSKKTYQNDN
jgi:hypothetical protein